MVSFVLLGLCGLWFVIACSLDCCCLLCFWMVNSVGVIALSYAVLYWFAGLFVFAYFLDFAACVCLVVIVVLLLLL